MFWLPQGVIASLPKNTNPSSTEFFQSLYGSVLDSTSLASPSSEQNTSVPRNLSADRMSQVGEIIASENGYGGISLLRLIHGSVPLTGWTFRSIGP